MIAHQSESPIISKQLRTARENLALSIDEVAERLEVSSEELVNWERGLSEPSVDLLWRLGDIYGRDTDYFLRQTPPLPEQLDFRLTHGKAIGDLPLEARKALVRFDELCRAQSDLEDLLGKKRRITVRKADSGANSAVLAHEERQRLRLGEHPIVDLRGILADQGIVVFELPLKGVAPEEVSGLSWWLETYGPCILVNARDTAGRRTFTLAHEYAHLLRSDPPTVCQILVGIATERFADTFAAEFLMPASAVEKTFLNRVGPSGSVPDDRQLGSLASHYNVSLEAMCWRLEELKLVARGTTDTRLSEWKTRQRHFRRPKSPPWRRQLGKEFVSLALDAHDVGRISISKLADYLGLDLRKALELTREHRG